MLNKSFFKFALGFSLIIIISFFIIIFSSSIDGDGDSIQPEAIVTDSE